MEATGPRLAEVAAADAAAAPAGLLRRPVARAASRNPARPLRTLLLPSLARAAAAIARPRRHRRRLSRPCRPARAPESQSRGNRARFDTVLLGTGAGEAHRRRARQRAPRNLPVCLPRRAARESPGSFPRVAAVGGLGVAGDDSPAGRGGCEDREAAGGLGSDAASVAVDVKYVTSDIIIIIIIIITNNSTIVITITHYIPTVHIPPALANAHGDQRGVITTHLPHS